MEILRDQSWQFWGMVLTVCVSIYIYRAQKSQSNLAFGVLSNRQLVALDTNFHSRIKVLVDGKPVENVHLIVCAIKNAGNKAFTKEDITHLNITFGEMAWVLDAKITRQYPENLRADLITENQKLCVELGLLNPGEYLVFQVLVSCAFPSVVCDARIRNVTELSTLESKSSRLAKSSFQSIVIAVLTGLFLSDIPYAFAKFVTQLTDTPFLFGNLISSTTFVGIGAVLYLKVDQVLAKISGKRGRFIEDV
jgi:hypothetical protein